MDELGILKVDCLSLGMLTAIHKCFDLVEQHHRRQLTLANIPHGDAGVYEMICRADTMGVFQIESRAQMSMLPRLRPREFYDLVIEVAIVRPGPIQGDMVHPYLRRRTGEEQVTLSQRSHPRSAAQNAGCAVVSRASHAAGHGGGRFHAGRSRSASPGDGGLAEARGNRFSFVKS